MNNSAQSTAKDYIVDIDHYAIVSPTSTIQQAVVAQEETHRSMQYDERYKHRIILIENKKHEIIGKITEVEILRALVPEYSYKGGGGPLSRFGLTTAFMSAQSMNNDLWNEPLHDICRKSAGRTLKDVMRPVRSNEFIDGEASLSDIIHRFITIGKKQLFVKNGKKTIGVIRLHDIFVEVCLLIKTCPLMGDE
jgi:hypothetical protein